MSWSNETLKTLAESQSAWVVESEGNCISISNDEGVDAFVYVGSEQILVEAVLFPAAAVSDVAELNAMILRTHHLLPLTAIYINKLAGEEYYVAFGSLSVDSKESVVVEEIETLYSNVGEFLELYNDHFNLETSK